MLPLLHRRGNGSIRTDTRRAVTTFYVNRLGKLISPEQGIVAALVAVTRASDTRKPVLKTRAQQILDSAAKRGACKADAGRQT